MRLLKHSTRSAPKISLILLDWSVRESFHLLHYLGKQDVDRDLFEVIIVEYYSRVSDSIRPFEGQVDTWLLLEMPTDCYYHKHLMYNAGIVVAKGDICVICDSDAMVKEGFIRAIISAFENAPDIVLHLDQFRNIRRDLYPFCFPSFEDVLGRGCINNAGNRTRGLLDDEDSIHNRNYGACMCARRSDLIAIGGADEHVDYLGHICGPYEMTFRLVNLGRREVWSQMDFTYHTWHPGQAGEDNHLGPHDGRHVSTTALDALSSGRVMPLAENQTIHHLRVDRGHESGPDSFQIAPEHRVAWREDNIRSLGTWTSVCTTRRVWKGFIVERTPDGFVAFPKIVEQPAFIKYRDEVAIRAETTGEIRRRLARSLPLAMRATFPLIIFATYLSRALGVAYFFMRRRLARLIMGCRA